MPSPFDCWLVLRGMRTLPWRMKAHSENAMKLATYLDDYPRISSVHYPGLTTNRAHAIAKKQMSAFGGMLSVEIRGGFQSAFSVLTRLKIFTRATSLGGVEDPLSIGLPSKGRARPRRKGCSAFRSVSSIPTI